MVKRAQASIELLTLLGISLVILGIILASARSNFEDSLNGFKSHILSNDLNILSNKLKDLYYGASPNSYLTMIFHIPASVIPENTTVDQNLIVFAIDTKYGVKEIPQPVEVPFKVNMSYLPGDHNLYLVAHRGYVFIGEDMSLLVETFNNKLIIRNPSFNSHRYLIYVNDLLKDNVALEPHGMFSINCTNVEKVKIISDIGEEEVINFGH